jgi:hypothetical protein
VRSPLFRRSGFPLEMLIELDVWRSGGSRILTWISLPIWIPGDVFSINFSMSSVSCFASIHGIHLFRCNGVDMIFKDLHASNFFLFFLPLLLFNKFLISKSI